MADDEEVPTRLIHLRPVRQNEHGAVVRLCDLVFGEGYLSPKEINERFLVLRVDGKLAGFVNTDIWDDEDATGEPGQCLGLITTVVIHSDFRGAGLGTILVGAAKAHLILDGVKEIECYATTWSDTGICFLKGSLLRNGFTESTHYPHMWKDDPVTYMCAACKKHPCLCDATLYRWEVNSR